MKTIRSVLCIAVTILGLMLMPAVRASFIPTSGTHDYTNAVNWVGGVVDGVVTNAQTGNIQLIHSGNLVLDHGWQIMHRSAENWYVQLVSDNGNRVITLGGDVFVGSETPSAQITPLYIGTATIGSGTFFIELGGNRMFADAGVSSTKYLRVPVYAKLVDSSGDSHGVHFTGLADWCLANENTFPGPLHVTAHGQANIGVQLTEKGTLSTTNIVVSHPGMLLLNNFSRADGYAMVGTLNTNRMPDAARISLADGTLTLTGGPGQAPETNSVTERVGPTMLSGHNQIISRYAYANGAVNGTVDTTSGNVRLEFASLTRTNCATARFAGGDEYKNEDPGEIGGTGLYSSSIAVSDPGNLGAINGILPWAVAGEYGRGRGLKLAKYDETNGFQALMDGVDNQTGFANATPQTNVRITDETMLAEDQTVNSLACEVSGGVTALGPAGKTVTLTSGALLIAETSGALWLTQKFETDFDFAGRPAHVFCGVNRSVASLTGTFSNIGDEGIAFVGAKATADINLLPILRMSTAQSWSVPTHVRDILLTFWGAVSPTNSAMTVSGYGILVFHGNPNVMIKSLAGEGRVYGSYSGWPQFTGTYTVGDETDTTFSGSIYSGWSDPEGNGNLIKRGTGRWTVDGANFCTGTTTVAEGTLIVNGSFANNTQTLISGGATLGGIGEVGALTVQNAAVVSPGAEENVIGMLSVAGGITLQSNGRMVCDVTSPSGEPGTGWDLLAGSGTLMLDATKNEPFVIEVHSMAASGEPGTIATLACGLHSWKVASAPNVTGFVTGVITVDDAHFVSDQPVHFSVSSDGNAGPGLYLNCDIGADASIIVVR